MNTRRAQQAQAQQQAANYQQPPQQPARKAPIGAFIHTEQPAYLIEHEKMMKEAAIAQPKESSRDDPVFQAQPSNQAPQRPAVPGVPGVPVSLVKKPKAVVAPTEKAAAPTKPVQMKPKKTPKDKVEDDQPVVEISDYEKEIVARYLKIDDEMIDLKNQLESLKTKRAELIQIVTQIMRKTGGAPVKSGNTELKVTTKTVKESMTKAKLVQGLADSGMMTDPSRAGEVVEKIYKSLGVKETKEEIKRK